MTCNYIQSTINKEKKKKNIKRIFGELINFNFSWNWSPLISQKFAVYDEAKFSDNP